MALIYKVKSVEAIYNALKQYLIGQNSTLTNFNIGSRNRTLLESIATILHQAQFDFSEAMKIAIPKSVYEGFEFARLGGTNAEGKINFYRSGAAGATFPIPIGTQILLDGLTYETTAAGSILIGNTDSGGIDSECTTVGTDGNIALNAIDTVSGYGSFINQPTGIEQAKNGVAAVAPNGTLFSGGIDLESDEDRIARFRNYVQSLARSTVLGILIGAQSVEGVTSASVSENDPSLGWVTVYADDGSGSLPPAVETELLKVLNGDPADPDNYPGYRAAGIQILVLDPTVIDVDVVIQLRILTNSLSEDADIEALAGTAIETYINKQGIAYDITQSEIIKVSKNAHPDIFDVVLSTPATNVTITANQVGRTENGVATVTVTSIRINP